MLKEVFAKNPQLSPNEQRELARVVGMDYDKVRKWFQNQRAYAKKNELFRLCFNLQISFKGF